MEVDQGRPSLKQDEARSEASRGFRRHDPSLTEDDIAKILEYVRRNGTAVSTHHGGKLYSANVEIGGRQVDVLVVESFGGTIKTGYPKD